jgi:hypothetical protein
VIKNKVKIQDGWMTRLLTTFCEKIVCWILKQELAMSPRESMLYMTYHHVGWEEAYMYQSIARISQLENGSVQR